MTCVVSLYGINSKSERNRRWPGVGALRSHQIQVRALTLIPQSNECGAARLCVYIQAELYFFHAKGRT